MQGGRIGAGPDTRLALTTADSVLAGVDDHPVRVAERLATTDIRNGGMAAEQSQTSLIAGMRWWEAAASNSAGAAAAARSSPFGLLWAGDPERAAFEATLSATVTHGHQAALAGAAALAAAIALAASGNGRLDRLWLTAVADICAGYPQRDVNGRRVAEVVRMVPDYLGREPDFEAYICEGAATTCSISAQRFPGRWPSWRGRWELGQRKPLPRPLHAYREQVVQVVVAVAHR